jgi:hypothetical protein
VRRLPRRWSALNLNSLEQQYHSTYNIFILPDKGKQRGQK